MQRNIATDRSNIIVNTNMLRIVIFVTNNAATFHYFTMMTFAGEAIVQNVRLLENPATGRLQYFSISISRIVLG